jgi:hypothetical protein
MGHALSKMDIRPQGFRRSFVKTRGDLSNSKNSKLGITSTSKSPKVTKKKVKKNGRSKKVVIRILKPLIPRGMQNFWLP